MDKVIENNIIALMKDLEAEGGAIPELSCKVFNPNIPDKASVKLIEEKWYAIIGENSQHYIIDNDSLVLI